jgi:flagellar biosynthesis/type III secretory pathway protein FliH
VGRLLKNAGRIVPAEVLGATEQAAAILAAAHAGADDVRRQAEAFREQARQQGYQQGYDDGRDAAAATLTGTLADAALQAERARLRAEPAAMRLAAPLASKMTEKIIGHALAVAPALLIEIAAQALQASRARAGVIRLRVHPADLAVLGSDEARRRLRARLAVGAELSLVADASVGRHGCVVETASVRLDARLSTQLAALERALDAEDARG